MVRHHKPATVRVQGAGRSLLIGSFYGCGIIPSMNSMGARIKALRQARRLTQAQLADRLNITQSAISQLEKSRTLSLSGDVLAGLCEHLTTTADFILKGAGSEDDFEMAMQMAEVSSIMRQLPIQARNALLDQARLLARATVPAPTPQNPFANMERRHDSIPVAVERRQREKQ